MGRPTGLPIVSNIKTSSKTKLDENDLNKMNFQIKFSEKT